MEARRRRLSRHHAWLLAILVVGVLFRLFPGRGSDQNVLHSYLSIRAVSLLSGLACLPLMDLTEVPAPDSRTLTIS